MYSEEREACTDRDPLRKPLFGELHSHTSLSFDAWTYDVRTKPADAYRFARGEAIDLPPLDADGKPTFSVRLARPLDFAAVTDHAEYLGETSLCTTPGSPAYDTVTCVNYRPPQASVLGLGVGSDPPFRADFCGPDGSACADAAAPVWRLIQDAAEGAYDRTSACRFTTFVAYEYSLSPNATNLHRNVIFRNAKALPSPVTVYDAPRPELLWKRLRAECADAKSGCDVISIPHNSNQSNGRMFFVEYPGASAEDEERAQAKRRSEIEPLLEIFQHKGDSECTRGLASVAGPPDELCDFEKIQAAPLTDCGPTGFGNGGVAGFGCTSWRDFARGIVQAGLGEERRIGANPFKLGFIASTDTHNGTPGNTEERGFPGHLGMSDRLPQDQIAGQALAVRPLIANPGGLVAVWAEENSRDAIFDALKRREVFGTSGPRIVARAFSGWDLPADLCARSDMVAQGYARGAPMGADLPPRPSGASAPKIIVSAMRDPGTADLPSAPLERIQIIKLWIDASGTPREHVFDIAGEQVQAPVDPSTCELTGEGADTLCAVWSDPAFDPSLHASYYARVLEVPTCRWSTHVCNSLTSEERAALGCDALAVPSTIQERAWTSPMWYTP